MTAYEMRISDWSADVCSSDPQRELWQPSRAPKVAAQCPTQERVLEHYPQRRHDSGLESSPRILGAQDGNADGAGDHVQQVAEEKLQHGVLAVEVVVDRGLRDAGGLGDVFDLGAVQTALRDQPGRAVQLAGQLRRQLPHHAPLFSARSEERRVGKEGVSTCKLRGVPV